jgi:hypothetical protein
MSTMGLPCILSLNIDPSCSPEGHYEVRMKNKRIAKSEVLHSIFVCSNVLTSNKVPFKGFRGNKNIKERGF